MLFYCDSSFYIILLSLWNNIFYVDIVCEWESILEGLTTDIFKPDYLYYYYYGLYTFNDGFYYVNENYYY